MKVELAMQKISNDKKVRSDATLDVKEFNNTSLVKKAKKGKEIVSKMPVFEKAFEQMCDNRVELSRRNDALKNKIGAYDE